MGPQSPASDSVIIQAAPRFASALGDWLLRCESCPSVVRRSLSDASVLTGQAAGPSSSWRALGRGKMIGGRGQIVFQETATGKLALWDERALVPIAGAFGSTSPNVRGVGSVDFDGDAVRLDSEECRQVGLAVPQRDGCADERLVLRLIARGLCCRCGLFCL